MRASWSGHFRIGNIMMPVKLYSATRSTGPQFIQLHAHDHSPVTRVTVCLKDGEELSEKELIRAAEHEGTYVELSKSDIERVGAFERNIAVRQFTYASEIEPIYYDKPYYMAPDTGGEQAYAILRRAFEKTGKVAIVTFLFYDRERLGMVSVRDSLLVLQTLRFAEEIVPRSEVRTPSLPQPVPDQVSTAARLIEHYSASFHAEDYRNQQQDHINELIERKSKGLAPRKQQRVAAETTPSDEITSRMKTMLGEKPKALQ